MVSDETRRNLDIYSPAGLLICTAFAFVCIFNSESFSDTCPVGYTDVTRAYPSAYGVGLVKNSAGQCVPVCSQSGFHQLRLSNGFVASLFSTKNTTPALNIRTSQTQCYADALPGNASGTLNVFDGETNYYLYSLNPDTDYDCPVYNTLSYSCGTCPSGTVQGTPPDSDSVMYGSVFSVSDDYGSCSCPGYVPNGWRINGNTHSLYSYALWRYDGDQTATINWVADSYIAIFTCNYCNNAGSSAPYQSVTYGGTLAYKSASALGCANPMGQTLRGYKLHDAYGRDMNQMVTGSLSWTFTSSMKLIPDWSAATGTSELPRVTHNIYYYCDNESTARIGTGTFGEGELVTPSDDYGNCERTGYVPNGWTVYDCSGTNCDSVGTSRGTKALYSYSVWNVTTDQRAVINWQLDSYIAIYECNTGTPTSDAYKTVSYGATFTPVAPGGENGPTCTAPSGTTFAGYDVLDAYGNVLTDGDSNAIVLDGVDDSITWNYTHSLKFRARWQ